jgi:CSLREA domain-containing protein
MDRRRKALAAAAVVIASFAFASSASAASIVVDTTADDAGGTTGSCSLREAIGNANTDAVSTNGCTQGSGTDAITFDPSLRDLPISLLPDAAHGGDANHGELLITSSMTIAGVGMGQSTINAATGSRVFDINGLAGQVGLSDLSVEGGQVAANDTAFGGGIWSAATGLTLTNVRVKGNSVTANGTSGDTTANGGGIYQSGTLTMDHTVVTSNTAIANNALVTDGSAIADGAGVDSAGATQITDSTIASNTALASDAHGSGVANGAVALGGGIFSSAAVSLLRSTISSNNVTSTAPDGSVAALGGGIRLSNGASTFQLSTIAANTISASGADTFQDGGGIMIVPGATLILQSDTIASNGPATGSSVGANLGPALNLTLFLKNTIVALPRGGTSANCDGPITSLGFNYDDTGTCNLNTDDDFPGFAPVLAGSIPVDNGGPTKTIALLPNAPIIDQGSNNGQTNPTQDQRGFARPVDSVNFPNLAGGTDIGAFEAQAPPIPTLTSTSPASPAVSNVSPEVTGTIASGPTSAESANGVGIFDDPGCSDPAVGGDTPTNFVTTGVTASAAANSTTTFYARSGNAYGIFSPCSSSFLTYKLDSLGPAVTIDTGPTDPTNHTPAFTFHGTDASPPIGFMCSVDKGTPSFSPCVSPFRPAPLADGSYTFRVQGTDALANVGAATTRTFKISTPVSTPPPSSNPPTTTSPAILTKKKCKKKAKKGSASAAKKCKKHKK